MAGDVVHNEEDIVARLHSNDENAFKWVFDRHYVSILYYARNILDQSIDAEDIVQEIFYTLWQKRSEFNSLLHIKSFLYKATRFSCIDQLRRSLSHNRQSEALLTLALNEQYTDSRMIEEELYRQIVQEITQLPDKYATILLLKYLHNLNYAQIAERLGVPEATIRKQKQRALEMLRTEVLKKQLLTLAGLALLLEHTNA